MFNVIVVGVDGSETAEAAARRAAELALATDSTLEIVSAYDGYEVRKVDAPEEFHVTSEDDAQTVAGRLAARFTAEMPGLKVTSSPVDGKPGEALAQRATELDAGLIVIGNKRVQGMARVFGNVAAAVAAKAPCDVYVVHTHGN
ncbi:universal stress protein [Nocardioides sp. GY 10127]|uniref:universal stress protein n=1 Tax=Nocardioides sp. GY 10127 TaxID=2569762 RepID=UPI0010A92925|nr:universal stress protein [Nocardioides sp. GY 10127]TIC82747.1 universal stress protein [Nocardioides sp. GY 10127]